MATKSYSNIDKPVQLVELLLDAGGGTGGTPSASSPLPVGFYNPTGGALIDPSLPAEVVGSVAAAATDSGKPVKTGGVYNATPPTYTTGQRGDTQLDTRGNMKVAITGLNGTLSPTIGTPTAFGQSAQSAMFIAAENLIHNGTNYDLQAKPNAASRIASAAANTNPTSAKATAGNVFRIAGNNVKASVVYLKIYNKATAPTVGTDVPVLTIPIPASAVFNIDIGGAFGFYLGTGIAYGFTTDAADNGTTALSAGDVLDFCLTYA